MILLLLLLFYILCVFFVVVMVVVGAMNVCVGVITSHKKVIIYFV
jgi:hypothetical protein